MNGVNSFKFKESNLKQKQALKELQSQHETEIEKLKLNHQKYKNQINLKHAISTNELHRMNEIKLAQQTLKNQETLDKLQESLDKVKERTVKQKNDLQGELEKQKEELKAGHEILVKNKKQQNQLIMQDLDHQASVELARIQRDINTKKNELINNSQEEKSTLESSQKREIDLSKNQFEQKRLKESDKFHHALLTQRKRNQDQLTSEKRKQQQVLNNSQKNFQYQFSRLKTDHASKKQKLQVQHEKDYKKNFEQNEETLQKLLGKKEAIVDRFKQMLKTKAEKVVEKNDDPFYQFTDLNPNYELNQDKNGYIVTIPIPEHEAKNINLSAHRRQIKITMDRNFDYTENGYNGEKDTVKRVESYTSKIPVEYIMDSKKIERSYEDGLLKFKIAFA